MTSKCEGVEAEADSRINHDIRICAKREAFTKKTGNKRGKA